MITVQELIDKLQEVEDKNREVVVEMLNTLGYPIQYDIEDVLNYDLQGGNGEVVAIAIEE